MTLFLSLAVCVAAPLADQAPAPDAATLDVPAAGALSGTLVVPGSPGRVPVALIIAGSGPTDRDGNSAMLPGKNDAYRMLADGLKARGIASLRYDKRGIGASAAAGGPPALLPALALPPWVTQSVVGMGASSRRAPFGLRPLTARARQSPGHPSPRSATIWPRVSGDVGVATSVSEAGRPTSRVSSRGRLPGRRGAWGRGGRGGRRRRG